MSMIRIGLDTTAVPAHPVGVGRYIVWLARALAELIKPPYELVLFAQPHTRSLIGEFENESIHWEMVGPFGVPARLLWEQVGLPQRVKKLDLALLHSPHYTRPLWLSCRSVVTIHDMTFFLMPQMHTRTKRFFFSRMIRYSISAADALLTISHNSLQDAISLFGDPVVAKMAVTTLGVDASFRPIEDQERREVVRRRYQLPEQFIVYVGTLEPRKNLPMLLRAYAQSRKAGVQTPLVLVGRRGWMDSEIFELLDQLELRPYVHLTGYVDKDDLPVVYNLAMLSVYPTLYEGFGLPALEALACGSPLITSAVSSLPEVVGNAGILLPPGNEDALAKELTALVGDHARRKALSQAGPLQAASFTWENTALQTLKVYRKVLEEK